MSRVGLVLGGGGAVGHGFHNGLLAALEDTVGFDARSADVIVGTSSGATIAGFLRAGLTGTDLAGGACGEPTSPRMKEVEDRRSETSKSQAQRPGPVHLSFGMPASPLGALAAARRGRRRAGPVIGALLPAGRVPTVSSGGPLDNLFPGGWPAEQLWISAVGIDNGKRVIFGREGDPVTDVPTAVAASCALPGLFAPVVVDDRRYIDGAMWSATNADVLADQGLDVVIVSAPLSGSTSLLHRWQRRHLYAEVRHLRSRGVQVMVVEPTRDDAAVIGIDIMNKRRRSAVTRQIRTAVSERLERGDLAKHRDLIAQR